MDDDGYVYENPSGQFGRYTLVKMVYGELIARSAGDSTASMQRDFRKLARKMGHMEPAFAKFVPVWHRAERAIFRSEGPGWAPLKPEYAAWKRHNYPGKPILQREGALVKSLTSRSRHSVVEINPRSLRLGTTLFYSDILGSDWGHGRPGRPHVLIRPQEWAVLNELCLQHLLGQPMLAGGRWR